MDVSDVAIEVADADNLTISNSYLAHGSQYTIRQQYSCPKGSGKGLPVFDLTNNDWGTTSADSIASWIHLCFYDATFIPYVGQPVPTEGINFGSLKSQYR